MMQSDTVLVRLINITNMNLLTICILCIIYTEAAVGQTGLPNWQNQQRTHTIQTVDDATALRVCRMTDINNIRQLYTPLNVPRIVGTPTHDSAANYISTTLRNANFTIEWDRFAGQTPYGTKTFRNLIATYNTLAPRRLTLACHYDSKYFTYEFIGATDSALPCTLMMDIAQTLSQYLNTSPITDLTLQMIFFDGEEAFREWTQTDSLYGARHLATKWANQWYAGMDTNSRFHLTKEIERIDVLMLLDLLGAANPTIRNHQGLRAEQHFSSLPAIEQQLQRAGCLNNINAIFSNTPSWSLVEDDHVPFMQNNVPVLHLISVPFPSVWHTQNDNMNALSWPTVSNLASILRLFVVNYLHLNV